MSKTVYVLIGLPRSGKSTWADQNREGKFVVSADAFRLALYGDAYNRDKESQLWACVHACLAALVSEGADVIIDNTNITLKSRRSALEPFVRHGYNVVYVQVCTSVEICLSRATQELKSVIDRMSLGFEALSDDDYPGEVWVVQTEC